MQELTLNARQQYHKHGVMHRALKSLKNCRCIKAIKLIISMVHNVFGLGEGGEFNHKSLIE